ncbi:MAG: hypothetical protein HXS54_09695 [Theionarchaea archaeon]|nr:hypothetical protein [Theionarchaea archaeon]
MKDCRKGDLIRIWQSFLHLTVIHFVLPIDSFLISSLSLNIALLEMAYSMRNLFKGFRNG